MWAFGVLVWEMFTLAQEIPYFLQASDQDVIRAMVVAGERLLRPDLCPENIFAQLVLPCWEQAPERRPIFEQLSSVARTLQNQLLAAAAETRARAQVAEAQQQAAEAQQQAAEATRRLQELQDQSSCRICFDGGLEVALTPCGHNCLCTQCAPQFPAGSPCPICRTASTGQLRIFT